MFHILKDHSFALSQKGEKKEEKRKKKRKTRKTRRKNVQVGKGIGMTFRLFQSLLKIP